MLPHDWVIFYFILIKSIRICKVKCVLILMYSLIGDVVIQGHVIYMYEGVGKHKK